MMSETDHLAFSEVIRLFKTGVPGSGKFIFLLSIVLYHH